jgi:hypothetical protein
MRLLRVFQVLGDRVVGEHRIARDHGSTGFAPLEQRLDTLELKRPVRCPQQPRIATIHPQAEQPR